MKLRPIRIDPRAWETLSERNRDLIATETVERLVHFPELAAHVTHQVEHAAKIARRFVEAPRKRVPLARLPGSQRLAAERGEWG